MWSKCSVKAHVGSLSSVPRGHLGGALEFEQVTGTGLKDDTLFFALVKQLLLSSRECIGMLSLDVFLIAVDPSPVTSLSFDSFIAHISEESGVECGPCWHQKLFLVGIDINNAILIFHEMLKAGCSVKNWRD